MLVERLRRVAQRRRSGAGRRLRGHADRGGPVPGAARAVPGGGRGLRPDGRTGGAARAVDRHRRGRAHGRRRVRRRGPAADEADDGRRRRGRGSRTGASWPIPAIDITDGQGPVPRPCATSLARGGATRERRRVRTSRPRTSRQLRRVARAALEAILLVVDEPVNEVVLARSCRRRRPTCGRELCRALAASTTAAVRTRLRAARGRRRMAVLHRARRTPRCVERFVVDGQQARLTQAALETLAVVAYRQPVSRARVSAVRGVNVDGVIRTLVLAGPDRGVRDGRGERSAPLPDDQLLPGAARAELAGRTAPAGAYLPDIETMDIDSVSPSG